MASRSYDQQDLSIVKQPVSLWAVVNVGAAGAVTLQKWNFSALGSSATPAKTYTAASVGPTTFPGWPQCYQSGAEGVYSVVRTNTGLWTLTLQDQYQRLLGMTAHISVAGGLSNIVAVGENTTISSMAPTGGGSIIGVALLSSTATAADPTSGHVVHIHLRLSNASEP